MNSDGAASPFGRLRIERTINAPIEDTWNAWTTASGLATWWWAAWDDTAYDIEAYVGGSYRIAAPTAGIAVSGVFRRLDRPHRIEMTWIWSDESGDGPEEVVEVEFRAEAGSTVIMIEHRGPWATPEPAANYEVGWGDVLDVLARR